MKTTESGALSKRDQLNRIARRQIEASGGGSMKYIAERLDILVMAKGFLEDNEIEEYDIMDILSVAEFLAGDRVEGA